MNDYDSTFISGIHNWCDRWCEKCAFTARCRVFEREQKRDVKSPEEFWNAVSDNFKETLEMLRTMAEERGIDIGQIIEESKADTSVQEDKILDEHPLSAITEKYLFEGKDWLDSSRIKNFLEELVRQEQLGVITPFDSKTQKIKIENALEVIQWYLFFIHVKSKRVLNDLSGDFWEGYPESEKSYNGSAKVAMIAIERSMNAWKQLLDLIEDEQDSILMHLVLLEKSRNQLIALVPNYNVFIRPGFDD
nr:hypothetical protein [Algoriphagus locisalis]